jgi:hypothetical protein
MEVDTIEHQGTLWLVPQWCVDSAGAKRPLRIISLHGLPLDEQGPEEPRDFVLPIPLSKDTLDSDLTQGLVVIEAPDIDRKTGTITLH